MQCVSIFDMSNCSRSLSTANVVVVVDIFYLQHMILYRKYAIKRSTRKKSHRRDLLISIVDLTFN